LLQQDYQQWYMLYQHNAHWHGEAAQASALVAVAAGVAVVASVAVALGGAAVEAVSSVAVASAVEEDSSSIKPSYRQSTKSIIVPAAVRIKMVGLWLWTVNKVNKAR
jgi:hypothetical protein